MDKQTDKNYVLFLCSPHIGILDNWMPVLWNLKAKKRDSEYICIVTKTNWLNKSVLSNKLIVLSDQVFDKILFKNQYEQWVSADSFREVVAIIEKERQENAFLKTAQKFKKNTLLKPVGVVAAKLWHTVQYYRNKVRKVNWNSVFRRTECLIYDIGQEFKVGNHFFLKNLKEVPKFSLFHGLITIETDGANPEDRNVVDNVTAYLFSGEEKPHYKASYGLNDESMKVTGIPRHHPEWIDFMMDEEEAAQLNFSDYIFIISRPFGSDFHPRERMKKSLEEIKKIAFEQMNIKVIVKIHPSEKEGGLYEEVFGMENKGEKWDYSSYHPFLLGKNALFAISFYSGVAVDLVAQGIPVIEKLDLRGLTSYKSEFTDKSGEPVMRYRYYNLMLGASSYDQLKSHVDDIMGDKEAVIEKLKSNYSKVFPSPENSIDEITSDILTSLKMEKIKDSTGSKIAG